MAPSSCRVVSSDKKKERKREIEWRVGVKGNLTGEDLNAAYAIDTMGCV